MPMITDEERREVARMLREANVRREFYSPWCRMVESVLDGIGCGEDDGTCDENACCERFIKRMADLIEPEPERKAKARPFPVEEDTGFFDTTKCECGYLNDVSAKFCGQEGGGRTMSLTYDVLKDDVRAGRPIGFGFVTYVPERACRMVDCSTHDTCVVNRELGNGNIASMEFGYKQCSECGAYVFDCPTVRYCPCCGAKVVER